MCKISVVLNDWTNNRACFIIYWFTTLNQAVEVHTAKKDWLIAAEVTPSRNITFRYVINNPDQGTRGGVWIDFPQSKNRADHQVGKWDRNQVRPQPRQSVKEIEKLSYTVFLPQGRNCPNLKILVISKWGGNLEQHDPIQKIKKVNWKKTYKMGMSCKENFVQRLYCLSWIFEKA